MAAEELVPAQNANPMVDEKENDDISEMELQQPVTYGTVSSMQDQPNPNLDEIQHVEMRAHDTRAGREENNDGLHLVTTHFLLSSETARREKYAWLAGSFMLLFVQMLSAASVMIGSFIPNCSGNHHCFEGQYCCPL
jgi:hypothetical protein